MWRITRFVPLIYYSIYTCGIHISKQCTLHAVTLAFLHINIVHHNTRIYSAKVLTGYMHQNFNCIFALRITFHHVLSCCSNTHQIDIQIISSILTILEYSQVLNNVLLVMHKWPWVAPTQRQDTLCQSPRWNRTTKLSLIHTWNAQHTYMVEICKAVLFLRDLLSSHCK